MAQTIYLYFTSACFGVNMYTWESFFFGGGIPKTDLNPIRLPIMFYFEVLIWVLHVKSKLDLIGFPP